MTPRLEIINIDEIPPEGKDVSFEIETDGFNERLSLNKGLVGRPTVLKAPPQANLKLEVRGVTVLVNGKASLLAEGVCSRCSEATEIRLSPSVSMVLKPKKNDDEIEDLNLGFYEGKEIDLGPIIEEQLILGLPFKVLCKDDCKGLCSKCGENLNLTGLCSCPAPTKGIESKPGIFTPFADLKTKFKV